LPLYDYRCRACSKVTEVRHGFGETHQDACPACGGELARVFSPAGIVFKGSGFYLTDSRKASEKAKASASSTSAEPAKPVETANAADSTSTTPATPAPAAAAPAVTPASGAASSAAKSESSAA
jgi:putative FmdB family regulatory protein